jgi:short-subunit dehydrogenase
VKVNFPRFMPTPVAALKNFTAVIVTGGSSGIGKSFIELIGKLRPEVAFCNLSRRQPVIALPQLNLRHIPCDLADPKQIDRALAEIGRFLEEQAPAGKILLINNSGFGVYGSFPEPGIAQQVEMVDVNVRAVLQLTAGLLPALKSRGGVVMTVASTAAFQPTAYLGAYGATKAFVLHWSLALNEELRGTGVRTLAVCPGPTSTEFFRRAGLAENSVPDSLGETSEEVVRASLRAMAAGKAMVVSGWRNKLMVAVATKFPKPLVARVTALILARYRLKRVKK